MRRFLITLPLAALLLLAGAIAFGGPGEPAPMASIVDPFKNVDISDLPAPRRVAARDGERLAYRAYAPQGTPRGSVVLLHGSSASSLGLPCAGQGAGRRPAWPPIRARHAPATAGFGHQGPDRRRRPARTTTTCKGFMRNTQPQRARATLAGFEAGGGFALPRRRRRAARALLTQLPAAGALHQPGRAHLPAAQRRLGQRGGAAHRRHRPARRARRACLQ